MFRILTFKSDGAFWPQAQRPAEAARATKGVFGRLVATVTGELAARRATRALASMDERMLRDIGVNRDQIWFAARHGREAMRRSLDRRTDFSRWS